jgi:hypothetical protein
MKVLLNKNGELEISVHYLAIQMVVAGFAAMVVLCDSGGAWAFRHEGRQLAGLTFSDIGIFLVITIIALLMIWAALRFLTFQDKLVLSSETARITRRTVLKKTTTSYPLSEVAHFTFRYFRPNRSIYRSARLTMRLRTGEALDVMTLPYISQAKKAHSPMASLLSSLGALGKLVELPPN